MKLFSIAAEKIPPPVNGGYLSFDEITTLVGANDTGKSTVLDFVRNVLSGDHGSSSSAHTIFVECESVQERDQLILHAAVDLFATTQGEDQVAGVATDQPEKDGLLKRSGPRKRSPRTSSRYLTALESEVRRNDFPNDLRETVWGLGIWSGRAIDGLRIEPTPSPANSLIRGLGDLLPGNEDANSELLDALQSSMIFGLRHGSSDDRWDVYWCLDPMEVLTAGLRTRLLALGYVLVGADAVRVPSDLTMEGSPLVCTPVGATKRNLTPVPIFLPTDTDKLLDRLADRLDQVQRIRRTAFEETLPADDQVWDFDSWENLEWIEEREDNGNSWFRVHPIASQTVSGIAKRINSHLPPKFPYEVRCEIWLDFGKGVEYQLSLIPQGGDEGQAFPISRVAEGFRPWLQFAILRAITECNQYIQLASLADELDANLQYWKEPPEALSVFFGDDFTDALEPHSLDSFSEILKGLVCEDGDDFNVLEFDLFRNNLLLMIDEPERQLHPGLQREIANWLRDSVLTQAQTQLLMATHALPFMRMGPSQELIRLRKLAGGSVMNSINAKRSDDFNQLAEDLGMDYGELLTLTKVILWVEGEHDRVILQSLFRERLWQHGITCIPMRGSSNGGRVVTVGPLMAEIIGLSKAKSIVWFDGIRHSVIDELAGNPSAASAVLNRIKEERKAKVEGATPEEEDACSLVAAAFRSGQTIQISAHPMGDIWDLLDPGSIESYADSVGVRYNHLAAMEDWRKQVKGGRRKSELKTKFLLGQWELAVTTESMKRIADLMIEQGVSPHPELEAIVAECERLSLELSH